MSDWMADWARAFRAARISLLESEETRLREDLARTIYRLRELRSREWLPTFPDGHTTELVPAEPTFEEITQEAIRDDHHRDPGLLT